MKKRPVAPATGRFVVLRTRLLAAALENSHEGFRGNLHRTEAAHLLFACSKTLGAADRSGEGKKNYSLSSLRTAMKASVGTCTVPRLRIFFLPSFCFSSSFFLRVMSPP